MKDKLKEIEDKIDQISNSLETLKKLEDLSLSIILLVSCGVIVLIFACAFK